MHLSHETYYACLAESASQLVSSGVEQCCGYVQWEHCVTPVMCFLSIVVQIENNTAQLLVLDAQNIDGEPTAVVHISERVPFGFHCEYIPGSGIPNWSRATTVADSSAVAV